MKIIVTIFLFFISFNLFAQNTSTADIHIGLNQSYRFIDDGGSETENVRNDLEIPKLNFHIGVNFNRLITSQLYVKSGLRFVSMGYKTEKRDLIFPTGDFTTIQFVYNYLFLEIPLGLRYEFVENTVFIPYIEAGFAPTIYATNTVARVQDGDERIYERIPSMRDFSTFHLSANVAAGVNYNTSTETTLFFQLNYKRHLTNLIEGDFKERLTAYGIEFGLRRSISKVRV